MAIRIRILTNNLSTKSSDTVKKVIKPFCIEHWARFSVAFNVREELTPDIVQY